MKHPTPRMAAALAAVAAALTTACAQTAYYTAQEMQKEQCRRLPDMAERQRCEKSLSMSYDKYQSEAEAAKRKSAP